MLLKTSPALPLRVAQEHLSADELCAGTLVAVAGNRGVGPLSLAGSTVPVAQPVDHSSKEFPWVRMLIEVWVQRAGGTKLRSRDEKTFFMRLAISHVPLRTFPEDLFHTLNNVLLHHHNRDSQPKGLKD